MCDSSHTQGDNGFDYGLCVSAWYDTNMHRQDVLDVLFRSSFVTMVIRHQSLKFQYIQIKVEGRGCEFNVFHVCFQGVRGWFL